MSNIKDNTSNVTIDMSHGGLGALVTECVRAFLHQANPSALMNRILQGVDQYRAEVSANPDEIRLNACLRHTVFMSSAQLQEVEGILFDTALKHPGSDMQHTVEDSTLCSVCNDKSKVETEYTPVSLCSDPTCPCE
jgi:hypothetical protein